MCVCVCVCMHVCMHTCMNDYIRKSSPALNSLGPSISTTECSYCSEIIRTPASS